MSEGDFIAAFEELATRAHPFAYPIEYIKPTRPPGHGRLECRERLGGLLKYYHQPAA